MNERMDAILQQVKQLRHEQEMSNRNRNRLLGWTLTWLLVAPLSVGGWLWYGTTQEVEAETTPPSPIYQLAAPPSCAEIGRWIVDGLNEDIDKTWSPDLHYRLGTNHIEIAPTGLRDYELVCLINVDDNEDGSFQHVGCSDRNGAQAKGGGVSSIDSAEMCLAILRGSYL